MSVTVWFDIGERMLVANERMDVGNGCGRPFLAGIHQSLGSVCAVFLYFPLLVARVLVVAESFFSYWRTRLAPSDGGV